MVTKTFRINEEEIIYSIKEYIRKTLNKKGLTFTIHNIELVSIKDKNKDSDISAYAEITTDDKIDEILQRSKIGGEDEGC